MSESYDQAELDLEKFIRLGLDREAEKIEPRQLYQRIEKSISVTASCPATVRFRQIRVASQWTGIAAAALLMAFGLGLLSSDRAAVAKVDTVVREARVAHQLPIDRCYLVELRRESSLAAELAPTTPQVRTTRLWTRGDRFWVESARPEQRWAWGRDESNRFWIAFGPHTAVRLDSDEVPNWLNLYFDLHSLNVDQWLSDVLNRFDLTRETQGSQNDAATIRVSARARPGTANPQFPSIETAEFEINSETRVVRRMVVRRFLRGQPFATVTYSLLETDSLDPEEYRLEGHLSENFEIFTRDNRPERRTELLNRWFGPRAARWFRALEPAK